MSETLEFEAFPKISRLNRECVITEKIDGTNALIFNTEDGRFLVGSRTRWITPDDDNFGFAKWAHEHREELALLGPGRHFGEWWGSGIQRRYDQDRKRFSLFNVGRWSDENIPECCDVVPTLFTGIFSSRAVEMCIEGLRNYGSLAADGFMRPEGIIVYHTAARQLFKVTLEKDEEPKGKTA